MELLKNQILTEGKVIGDDILKVDMFLNHQIDVNLLNEMGKEFQKRFATNKVTKILTVEASGIAIACITAQYFKVPVVFAKKFTASNMDNNNYESEVYSYTKNKKYTLRVSKDFLSETDHVLILDDFLANGNAALALCSIVQQANATVSGIGVAIEKGFQDGGKILHEKGFHVESLAIIGSLKNGDIQFK